MFETAIVCTDLSSDSDDLAACASGLAVLGVRKAILTHVVNIFDDPEGVFASTNEAAETYQRQLESLERSGLTVRVEAPLGHPALSLEQVRRRHSADLIVMGHHGAGGPDAAGSHSISADLLQLSDTPLLLTPRASGGRESDRARALHAILRHVLCCVDPPDAASTVFDKLIDLIHNGVQDVTLLHVQDRQPGGDSSGRAMPEHDRRDAVRMAHMRDALIAAGAKIVRNELVCGTPADELARRAASGEYSLIVLGNRAPFSHGEPHRLGQVSDRIVKESTIPVLLVPAGEKAMVA